MRQGERIAMSWRGGGVRVEAVQGDREGTGDYQNQAAGERSGMIVVGVDPDSSRHGVAIYSEGQLTSLHLMTRGEVMRWLAGIGLPVMFSIENALANNF